MRELYILELGNQHRGFESAGAAIFSERDKQVHCATGTGYVKDAFREVVGTFEANDWSHLMYSGKVGIAHNRYSTTGASNRGNRQPIQVGKVTLGHNGNLSNAHKLRERFSNYRFRTTTDSEVIGCIFDSADNFFEGAEMASELCQGSYNLVMINNMGELAVFRDTSGNHPLFVGTSGDSFYASSEDFGLPHGTNSRLLNPGEIVVISERGMDSKIIKSTAQPRFCAFESPYFGHHGSTLRQKPNSDIRHEIGGFLAKTYPVDADIVVPVLDSGLLYSIGYSKVSGIEWSEGIPKNAYLGRTYMSPDGKTDSANGILSIPRHELVRLKHKPMPCKVGGKRVVVTDDSIVRKTVSTGITQRLREAGAAEIHWRIGFPPVRFPCFYGLDHARRRDLPAARFNDPLEAGNHIAKSIDADSVRFIPKSDLAEILGNNGLCFACVDGEYWTDIDQEYYADALRLV